MTGTVLYRLAGILGPVAFHFLVINMVQMTGLHADAASLTTVAAVIVLPFFFRELVLDERRRNPDGRDGFVSGQEDKGRRTPGSARKRRFHKLGLAGTAEIILLALGCNFILTLLMNLLEGVFTFSNETQEALLGSGLPVQVIGLGILVPVMEEVLFRGLVYQRLRDYNKGWLSVLLAAGIFAVYHGNAVQILFAFPMGCILIVSYEKWKTLKAPILFHMTVNLSSVLVTAWMG